MAVVINGRDLTVEEVIRVCRGDEKVEIAPEAQKAIQKARDYIEKTGRRRRHLWLNYWFW